MKLPKFVAAVLAIPTTLFARTGEWHEYSRYDEYAGGSGDADFWPLVFVAVLFVVIPYIVYKKYGEGAMGVYFIASPFICGAIIGALASLKDGNYLIFAIIVGVCAYIAKWLFYSKDEA
ncbi:hypothetical protein AB833_02015 [Chromatiales bacterium (ex Bugula neritina AB1)]|nr:hypothetical protein AB833_02015 [Chromatiales bacterium (ex Bugula neritina AB1)]